MFTSKPSLAVELCMPCYLGNPYGHWSRWLPCKWSMTGQGDKDLFLFVPFGVLVRVSSNMHRILRKIDNCATLSLQKCYFIIFRLHSFHWERKKTLHRTISVIVFFLWNTVSVGIICVLYSKLISIIPLPLPSWLPDIFCAALVHVACCLCAFGRQELIHGPLIPVISHCKQ